MTKNRCVKELLEGRVCWYDAVKNVVKQLISEMSMKIMFVKF